MTFLSKTLAPGIYLYEDIVDFTEKIVNLSVNDIKNWNIKNQNAIEWKYGDKIVGYDEYPVNFTFFIDESFLLLGKKIFDRAFDYSIKNLTVIETFDSFIIRKYTHNPGFLELESSDFDNSSRKVTSILFLNTIDEGGQLTFKNFDISVPAKAGSIVVFPASFAYSFKINRPKESDSLVVVSHFV